MAINIIRREKEKKRHVQRPGARSPGVKAPTVVSDQPSRAHKNIMSLGQQRVDHIVARIVAGDKLTAICREIREDWGMFRDVEELTLLKEVSRFRKERVDGKLLWLQSTKYASEAMESFGAQVDALEGMTKLVQMQQERVSKAFLRERDLPMTLDSTRKEVGTLAELYARLSEMQMDLGIVRRVPREMLVASVEVAASKAGQAIEDAIARNDVTERNLAKAFELLRGEFEDLVADDAGIYSPAIKSLS